jgi:uncharacterized protein
MTTPANTQVRPRILLADSLRGFALMGLFIVHMVEYFELYWYKPEPGWVHNLIFFLFGGKAYGIFALLFGLTFFIILDNNQRRGRDFRLRFCWRLTLLLALGYLHSLLYAGDILQLLALCGFLLVVSHGCSIRTLALIAGFFLVQIPQIALILIYTAIPGLSYDGPVFPGLMTANFEAFAYASLPELVQHNLLDGQLAKWAFFIETGRLWNIIGLMFAGAVLGRVGFFEQPKHHHLRLIYCVIAASAAYLVLMSIEKIFASLFPTGMPQWLAGQLVGYYMNLAVIAAGIWIFVLFFQFSATRKLLLTFAPAGKMTLTFYLVQSLVFVPLFYGFGLGAYAYIGQVSSLALGAACWILQMLVAWAWLQKFRYGPLEWVWRRATLMGLQENPQQAKTT